MLALLVGAALGIAPPFLCNGTLYASCQLANETGVTHLTHAEYTALNDPAAVCTLCNPVENCTAPPPPGNIQCYPHAKSCSVSARCYHDT